MFFAMAADPGVETDALTWSQVFHHYWTQNLLVLLTLLIMTGLTWALLRRAHWRLAFRHVVRSKIAVVCAIVCGFFGLITLLDSIYYPTVLLDSKGQVLVDRDGNPVCQPPYKADSLLDRLLYFSKHVERTYSAPLADAEFQKTMNDQTQQREFMPLKYPGSHLLGTDKVGVDVLYACFKGVRNGVLLGALTTLLAAMAATLFGIVAGFFGGIVDDCIQYLYTTIGSIPEILLIIAFVQVFGRGLFQLCVIMGITSWVGLCRLLRGETMKLREMEYVQAARALGVPWYRILATHILPNVLHIILISVVLRFSGLVLAEAVLAYIGVGVDPGAGSWGNMINSAKEELSRDPVIWWILLGSFLSMLALIFPANLLGDQIRDALDPKLRKGEE